MYVTHAGHMVNKLFYSVNRVFETKEKKSPGAFNFDMLTFIAENIPADVN